MLTAPFQNGWCGQLVKECMNLLNDDNLDNASGSAVRSILCVGRLEQAPDFFLLHNPPTYGRPGAPGGARRRPEGFRGGLP